MMRRLVVLALVVLVLAVGATAWWGYTLYRQPFRGYPGDELFVDIAPGSSVTAIARRLANRGAIRHAWLFRVAAWRQQADTAVQAGEYRFDRPMTVDEVLAKLVRGDVYLRPLTIREGLVIEEMAEVFETRGFGPADEFLAAARDPSLVRDIDPEAPDLEGYLFPETYALPRQATARDLVAQMVQRFRDVLTDEARTRAAGLGLTVREVVTLASLVERETAVAAERPLVAAVYHGRIARGMLLQCDPTVIYALRRRGTYDGNITRADLGIDSPYNTYRYPGLPPGPIAAPGRASVEAVLAPANVDYLYFVSRNDGSHAFARTLDEHNRNVFEYQIKYFRDRRARERASQERSQ